MSGSRSRRLSRLLPRLLPFLIAALLAYFLFRQGADWQALLAVIDQFNWSWLPVILVGQVLHYAVLTWLNQILLLHYGAAVPFFRLYAIQLAMAFIDAVLPAVAVSSVALRIRLLRPYGADAGVSMVTNGIEMVLVVASVVLVALAGAAIMVFEESAGFELLWPLLQSTLLILVGAVLFGFIFLWQWRRGGGQWLVRVPWQWIGATWDQRIVTRWPNRLEQWGSDRIATWVGDLLAQIQPLLAKHKGVITLCLVLRLIVEGISFAACLYAFGLFPPPGILLLLYTLTLAVNTLGAIPGGVGVAELSLSVLFVQFGMDLEVAITVALLYRLTGYWLPRLAGGLSWLWMERLHRGVTADRGR
jgi:putative heme transporter